MPSDIIESAMAARAAARAYAHDKTMGDYADLNHTISDLICDLMHLCDLHDLDRHAILASAYATYTQEVIDALKISNITKTG